MSATLTSPSRPASSRRARCTMTSEERTVRQQASQERLEQAVIALQTSEGWTKWLKVRASLRGYTLNNQLLIALQAPDATRVAGFRAWLKLGYQVRKGEKAIRILAPRLITKRDEATDELVGKRCVGFLDVAVFDISQTEPCEDAEPLPLEPPSEPITGDSHGHLITPLQAFATELGFTVEPRDLSNRREGGWCDYQAKRIVIDSSQAVNAQVRIVIHELAHACGVSYAAYGRCQAEVIVDATTYCVLDALGLDVSGETVPYVAGYGDTHTSEHLRAHAELTDTLAKRIETACTGGSVREPELVAA